MKTYSVTVEETPDKATDRPLVTFALFAYNQEQYIREAVGGAFAQAYEPLEIILSDDCSSDKTFEIIQEMAAVYEGPHQVRVRQNDVNLGLAGHINKVVQHSIGEILVLAAGDDISLPDRTCTSIDLLHENKSAAAALLSADVIDDAGKTLGERRSKTRKGRNSIQTIEDLLSWNHITFGATRAVRREVFTKFGPLNENCPTEDTPLLLRSLILGTNAISQRKVIQYRRHDSNLSGAESMKKMNIAAIYQQYTDDIETAESLNIITCKVANNLRRWLKIDHRVRNLRLRASLNERIGIKDAIFLIGHPSMGFRSKIKFIMEYLLGFKAYKS